MALSLLKRGAPLLTASAALLSGKSLGLLWKQRPYSQSHSPRANPLKRLASGDAALVQASSQVVEALLTHAAFPFLGVTQVSREVCS